jgi:acyl-CoA thioesterase-1
VSEAFGRRIGEVIASALERHAAAKRRARTFEKITDDPELPRVLLLGDSISIGYTVDVRDALAGVANVHRAPTNCGPTTRGLENIDGWLGEGDWDVIHFNFGLHDLKYVDENLKNTSPSKGSPQVPLEAYAENLDTLVNKMKKTGAQLIFATTTPVPEGEPQRVKGDAIPYNRAAGEVMARHGVRVNDLYGYIYPHLATAQIQGGNVHFVREGSAMLGARVAEVIRAVLGK